ncbi:MAG TPA: protein kinase [Vicinamibacterales bacterium]|nr:protein kinase [Vicinamibacterales bacterium]
MSLAAGTHIGSHRILGAIGAGGMGEVYRAHDTKLGRDVALKILPDAFCHDAERLARFEREARTLATLNHPNIAAIYGIEESAPAAGETRRVVRALVMELVAGDDLAVRMAAGPVGVADALTIARQIALALEAAHEAGIVHRDLKPGNIKLRDDGTVKVLDFGLAKALGSTHGSSAGTADGTAGTELGPGGPGPHSAAMTSPAMTQLGLILGTAAYMSPEQAKGRPVDRRADVWAFGVVLYEMLSGRKLFAASDVSDTLAAVLTREPDWQALPDRTPPAIRRLLSRCLVRDPRARLDSMGAARLDVEEATREPAPTEARPTVASRTRLFPVALVMLGLLAGALLSRWLWPARSNGLAVSAPITASISAAPEAISAFAHGFALSPDGATLVYAARTADGQRRLWKRPLADPRAEAMPGTDGAVYPFWSPDSREVGFFADSVLKRIPISGGPAQSIAQTPGPWPRGSWNAQGDILFSVGSLQASGIQRVAASGGRPAKLPIDGTVYEPQWLPDGRRFLYLAATADAVKLMAASVDSSAAPITVLQFDSAGDDVSARYSLAGFLVFNRGGVLSRQRFDATTLKADGPVMPLGDRAGSPRGWLAVSSAGASVVALNPSTAAMGGTPGDPVSRLQWVDRSGRIVGELGAPARYWTMRLSRDGLTAIVNPDKNIWAIDARSNLKTRVAPASGAVWMPDGRAVVYRGDNALWTKSASGEGQPRLLVKFADRALVPTSVSSDGSRLTVTARANTAAPSLDVFLVTIADGSIQPLLSTEFDEGQASFSPDGRWIAYASNQTGRDEAYVRPLAGPGSFIRLSADGGQHPMWRADSQELFFLSPTDEVVAVDMAPIARTGAPGARTVLFRVVLNDIVRETLPPFAVAPDGKRFLLNVPAAPEPLTLFQLPAR